MSRIHDMGGRLGYGPVQPTLDAAVFAQDWHARALAVTLAAGALGQWNLDMMRHARECLWPGDYMRFGYYEKWLAALADMLVAQGLVSTHELRTGQAQGSSPLAARCLSAAAVGPALARGAPTQRHTTGPSPWPVGARLRTQLPARNMRVAGGHTRLPAYLAGKTGRVLMQHGSHILPDSHAHGQGEAPEPLYTVVFDAAEVWGQPERAGDEITADLWHSYLAPE